jgi:type 1 glutamine amidotransferase
MHPEKRALFIWGGWEGHEPEQTTARFAERLRALGYHVDVRDSPDVLEQADQLARYDLIVVCMTMTDISDAQEKGLLQAVRAGTGLGGWHGGLADAFRNRTEYQFMVGGQWVAHPGNDSVSYTVNITALDDPVMEGIDDFRITSEQYYLHVDPGVEVLATTTFTGEHAPWIDGVVMPVVWKKRYGQGKVFYCSLGHQDRDFESPEAATIVERGLVWATR